jgi:mono/diheme cytochrome c family protein
MKRFIKPVLATAVLLAGGPVFASTAPLDPKMVEQGRYIARVAGCNDCHTPGYAISDGKVDESLWLSGDSFGWRGPWGTTYGANLRLFVSDMTEDAWVEVARTLRRRPPMPWFNLNEMKPSDLRALYQFMRSLGDPGQPAPAYLPPDQEPEPPYASFPAPPPAQ